MLNQCGKWMTAIVLAAAVNLTASVPAHADITFELGNNPQPNEENILFVNPTLGSAITGQTNQSHIGVNFSSTTDMLDRSGMGQADVFATDGSLANLTISIPGGYYTDVILDPMLQMGQLTAPGGTADITVIANDGTFTDSYVLGSGSNFLTIFATNDEMIYSTTISMEGDGSFVDLKQPRISGAALDPAATPEPCTLAILGIGALPLLRLRRRHRQA